jgi:hypothetical protein
LQGNFFEFRALSESVRLLSDNPSSIDTMKQDCCRLQRGWDDCVKENFGIFQTLSGSRRLLFDSCPSIDATGLYYYYLQPEMDDQVEEISESRALS